MTHHRCKKQYQISVGKEVMHETSYKNSADLINESGKNIADQFSQTSQTFIENYKSIDEAHQGAYKGLTRFERRSISSIQESGTHSLVGNRRK